MSGGAPKRRRLGYLRWAPWAALLLVMATGFLDTYAGWCVGNRAPHWHSWQSTREALLYVQLVALPIFVLCSIFRILKPALPMALIAASLLLLAYIYFGPSRYAQRMGERALFQEIGGPKALARECVDLLEFLAPSARLNVNIDVSDAEVVKFPAIRRLRAPIAVSIAERLKSAHGPRGTVMIHFSTSAAYRCRFDTQSRSWILERIGRDQPSQRLASLSGI